MRLFARLYAGVMRFAPESFRNRYAREAAELAALRVVETRGRGRRAVRAVRELADAVGAVRVERRAAMTGSPVAPTTGVTVDSLIRDFRQALRGMVRTPASSSAAILTYALGIGANVAIFSVAWPALFAPLPFPGEDRLTAIWLTYAGQDRVEQINPVSPGDFADLRTAQSFSAMAAYSHFLAEVNVAAAGTPQQLQLGHVTPSFFAVMGVRPTLGRAILPSDGGGREPVIVLSERAWRMKFGADPSGRRTHGHVSMACRCRSPASCRPARGSGRLMPTRGPPWTYRLDVSACAPTASASSPGSRRG